MSDQVQVDFTELDMMAAALGEVAETAGPFIRKAVEVTARNIKDHWRDQSKGLSHLPAFPHSISYDIGVGHRQSLGQMAESIGSGSITSAQSSTLVAEIGPDKDKPQGALGNLIEYGSVNNPPQGLGHAALQANEADFTEGLSKALRDAERKAGL